MTSQHLTHTLRAGALEARFLPEHGMLGVSLTHRGEEILRRVDEMPLAEQDGRSVGIPLNHPWANRLSEPGYRFGGREVRLNAQSELLMRDWNDVIVHGVRWYRLPWRMVQGDGTSVVSRLVWDRPELLEVFPFPHELQMRATLDEVGLTVETTMTAGADGAVPVSFGFHPYIGLPGVPRAQWDLHLPPMQSIVLDDLLLPTGRREAFAEIDGKLADMEFDHGFAFTTSSPSMSIAGAGRRVSVDFLRGFGYAQIYGPTAHDYISFEPMVAPANALRSGEDLPVLQPGEAFTAAFRIRVETADAAHE